MTVYDADERDNTETIAFLECFDAVLVNPESDNDWDAAWDAGCAEGLGLKCISVSPRNIPQPGYEKTVTAALASLAPKVAAVESDAVSSVYVQALTEAGYEIGYIPSHVGYRTADARRVIDSATVYVSGDSGSVDNPGALDYARGYVAALGVKRISTIPNVQEGTPNLTTATTLEEFKKCL